LFRQQSGVREPQSAFEQHEPAGRQPPAPQFTWPGAHGPQAPEPLQVQLVHSVHEVPFAAKPSGGQAALVPGQVSATSQSLTAARHVLPERKESAGQTVLVPSQFSATSQTPALGRQVVVDGWTASLGQLADAPVQFSAMSQTPALGRHVVVEG
jgi:hypothetical protein